MVVRFVVNFWHEYPPAIDAAYYPLQVRHLLTVGRLMYDDLPLIFWIDAVLAKFGTLLGMEMDTASMLASRVVDSFAEPWSAVFVMALGYVWSKGNRRALAGCAVAASFAVLSPPIMRMLSDFQKNSLGFVWMAAVVWVCRSAMCEGGIRKWGLLAVLLALGALTHVGVFGVMVVLVGLALTIWAVLSKRLKFVALLGGGLIALIGVVFVFEPRRGIAIVQAPLKIVGWAGPLRFFDTLVFGLTLFVVPLAFFALRRVRREREDLSIADRAVVISAALTALLLIGPINGEYLQRLAYMAPIPAAMVFAFVIARRTVADTTNGPAYYFLIAVLLVAAVVSPAFVPPPLIGSEAAAELKTMRRSIDRPESSLVVATHGLEWWSGYFLHTAVRVDAIPPGAFAKYEHVFVLKRTPAFFPVLGPPGLPGPPEIVIGPDAKQIYAGRLFELYEAR